MSQLPITSDTSNRFSRVLTLAAVALILAGGFYLRILDLGAPSFNEDELFHVRAAMSINETGRPTLPGGHDYRRAVVFTRLMAAVFRHAGGPGEYAARMIPVVFGTLLIFLTFLAGRLIADRATGVLAALFVAVSPYAILLSRFARMYAMHQCLYLVTFLLFFWAFERDDLTQRRRAALMAVASGLFLFSIKIHEIGAFFGVGLFGYCLWRALQTAYLEGPRAGFWSRYGLAASFMTIAGLSALALPAVREKILVSWRWVPEWAESNVGNIFYYRWFLLHEYGLWCYLSVPGALWLACRRPREGAYLVSHFVWPLLILMVWPLKQTRYMAHLFPLFLILVAAGFRAAVGGVLRVGLEAWSNRGGPVSPPLARAISAPVFVAAGVIAIAFSPGAATPAQVRGGNLGASAAANFLPWREAGAFLKQNAGPGDRIIASRTPPVLYYFGRVDYSLDRQGEAEIKSYGFKTADGRFLDNPGGVPYLEGTTDFEKAIATEAAVWLALQKSLFRADRNRLSAREREIISSDFALAYTTPDGSILLYRRPHK